MKTPRFDLLLKTPRFDLLLVVLMVLLAAPRARATVLVPLDLDTLVRRAHLIVRGAPESSRSEWANGTIQTVTRVRVESLLKGQAPEVVEVRTPGGSVGELTQKVFGAPELTPGEPVILFLHELPGAARSRYAVEGFSQGKFDVIKGPGGTSLVAQRLGGIGLLQPGGKVVPAREPEPIPERDFVERIRRSLQSQEAP